MTDPVRVLFLCTDDSCRPQMAVILQGDFGGEDFEVYSGGKKRIHRGFRDPAAAPGMVNVQGVRPSGARGRYSANR